MWHKDVLTPKYSNWKDTHTNLYNYQDDIYGVIAIHPIEYLDERIPQFIVNNSYDIIRKLAAFSYKHFNGTTIAITGTTGEFTTKSLLNELLSINHSVEATKENYNSRMEMMLTIANAITNPDYLVLEVSEDKVWHLPETVVTDDVPPDIVSITSVGSDHQRTVEETALLKSQLTHGMNYHSYVILNRDMDNFERVYDTISN
ncbi:Mur ligase family protein [Staphylococcus sp. HMSC072E01]|uniref:Mur ligase family protein n=1 Tax=Staphylococcus sp. HMSC072E01 TaxID=1739457 RepID=UPI002109E3F9|nr:Mur ligase family protein [Staphylococcus sp. HMSC072E01]